MIVVDASVAFKWFTEESDFEKALNILENHLNDTEGIIAPELIVYELANSWTTKAKLPLKQAQQNLQKLKSANLKLQNYNFDFLEKVITFSKKYHVSVYDASYAVLAKEKKCSLISADTKFTAQVNLPFVQKLSDYAL